MILPEGITRITTPLRLAPGEVLRGQGRGLSTLEIMSGALCDGSPHTSPRWSPAIRPVPSEKNASTVPVSPFRCFATIKSMTPCLGVSGS